MSVVLRCPSCGTTEDHTGECDACHEAEVRYFCTNHTPGLWLDTTTCTTCGARFGQPDPRPSPPAPSTATRARPPERPSAPPDAYPRTWEVRVPRTRERFDDEPGPPRMPPWQKLLLTALRARYRPLRTGPMPGRAPMIRGVGGCLSRLLLVAFLLLLAVAGAVFFLGRSLLSAGLSY